MEFLSMYSILLFFIGMFAAVISTLAGSGGLLTFPAMLLIGVPVHSAIAANKFSTGISSFSSFFTLLYKKEISLKMIGWIIPASMLGGVTGGIYASSISEDSMTWVAIFLLVFALLLTFQKKPKNVEESAVKGLTKKILPLLYGIGFFDGMFGPGSGTLLMNVFHYLSIPYMKAIALARLSTFLSCFGAFLSYVLAGHMMWAIAIPLAAGSIIGAQIALRIAPHLSKRHVQYLLRTISILLVIQLSSRLL